MSDAWLAAIAPIVSRDPQAFLGRLGLVDVSLAGLRTRLLGFIDLADDSLAIRLINNELSKGTASLNQAFGTNLSAPQFQAPAVAPDVLTPPLTPAQVTTLGTGVDLSQIDRSIVEAAAILAPDSEAARFVSQPIPVPIDDPDPIFAPPAPPTESLAPTIQPPGTFQALADAPFSGPAPSLRSLPAMAVNTFDPSFVSSTSTALPATGNLGTVQLSGSPFDPIGALIGALGGLQGGGGVGGAVLGGALGGLVPGFGTGAPTVTTAPLGPTFGGTPGFVSGQPTQPGGTEQQLLDLLRGFPPAQPGFALADLIGITSPPSAAGAGGVSIPLNGAVATTGLPIAPVLNTTVTATHRAPKGYVVVEIAGSNGQLVKVAMWKPLARSLKLFKSRPKPPISASEMKSLRTAKRVGAKVKKAASLAGFTCAVRGKSRRRAAACK